MTKRHSCALLVLGLMCVAVLEAQQYTITTVAGNGGRGYTGDSGPAPAAQLNLPGSVRADAKGNLYIADAANHCIRMVSGGTITTVAGNGTSGYTGDGSAATKATLNNPTDVVVDSSGNLYIADTGNNVIRKVAGGNISTFAGNVGNSGNGQGYGGDGGPATSLGVLFAAPSALALDSAGNLYIADSGNGLIREVSGGNINTVIGAGSTATKLNHPAGLTLDRAGNIYIADTGNRRVYFFSTVSGSLTTVAGNGTTGFSGDNGPATAASLNNPNGVALDGAGNLYIADRFNSRVRAVSPGGIISTIAGNGRTNYTGDGGSAVQASLNFPNGVTADASGNVYIADTANSVIRMLQAPSPTITTGVVNAGSNAPLLSAGAIATVFGTNFASSAVTGNAPLQTALGGVSVNVNGQLAPIQFVNGTQVNFQVPWETTGTTASITVSVGSAVSSAVSVPLAPAGPGLFAGVQNADLSTNSASNPAAVGSTIQAFLTGTGPVAPAIADGAAAPSDGSQVVLQSQTSATIGGEAAEVTFAGLAPGMVGVGQFSILVPSDLVTGDYPLVLGINDETSNPVTVSVTQ